MSPYTDRLCPKCNMTVDKKHRKCPNCGHDFGRATFETPPDPAKVREEFSRALRACYRSDPEIEDRPGLESACEEEPWEGRTCGECSRYPTGSPPVCHIVYAGHGESWATLKEGRNTPACKHFSEREDAPAEPNRWEHPGNDLDAIIARLASPDSTVRLTLPALNVADDPLWTDERENIRAMLVEYRALLGKPTPGPTDRDVVELAIRLAEHIWRETTCKLHEAGIDGYAAARAICDGIRKGMGEE